MPDSLRQGSYALGVLKAPKSGKVRSVPMASEVEKALARMLVARGDLVSVVRRLAVEDEVQAHVEVEVVDRPAQRLGARAAGEEDGAGMAGQVGAARLDEPRLGGGRGVTQGEVDVVRKQGLGHGLCTSRGRGDRRRWSTGYQTGPRCHAFFPAREARNL